MALTQLNAQFLLVFLAGLASGSTPRRIGVGEVTYDATQVSSDVSGCRQPGPRRHKQQPLPNETTNLLAL